MTEREGAQRWREERERLERTGDTTPPDPRDVVERGEHLRRRTKPGVRSPFVDGPTGPAPLATELRGDPGEGDDAPDLSAPGDREAGRKPAAHLDRSD